VPVWFGSQVVKIDEVTHLESYSTAAHPIRTVCNQLKDVSSKRISNGLTKKNFKWADKKEFQMG
jgi:hypothetical protein